MRIIIDNIKMPIRHTTEDVRKTAPDIVRSDCISADNFEIYRQSLDARRKNNIHYVYSVSASTAGRHCTCQRYSPCGSHGKP